MSSRFQKFVFGLFFTLLTLGFFSSAGLTQNEDKITVQKVSITKKKVPNTAGQGNVSTEWLCIEAEFSTTEKWTDEAVFKFYLEGYDATKDEKNPEFITLVAEAKAMNIPESKKGKHHMIAAFLHPDAVDRFGDKKGMKDFNASVVVIEEGKEKAPTDKNMALKAKKDSPDWFKEGKETPGFLLPYYKSPFWPAYCDRYPQPKTEAK